MKINGLLTISKRHSNVTGDSIHIVMRDEASGCEAFDVELSLFDFANAITGLACVHCTANFNNSGVIGLRAERKEELVYIPPGAYGGKDRAKNASACLKQFEKDGWVGSVSDATNHHRIVRGVEKGKPGQTYRVGFHRYLNPDGTPWTQPITEAVK